MPHVSPITCVDHHDATALLVTGGYDGRVIGWCDGEERWTTTFDDLVNDVRISADGVSIAVAAADAFAFVLDAATGAHVAALGPHGDDVNVVRWLPGGHGLVCVMDHVDPTVRVWERRDGTWEGRILARHDSGVFGAAVSADGRLVATAAEDRTARIWELATGRLVHTLHHPGDPETIDWSPDGSVIATGCDDDICRLWSPETGAVVLELKDATAAVRFVRFSGDGSHLLVGAYDATMRSYCTQTWTIVEEFRAPMQWERAGCVAGDRVAIGSFGAEPVFHPPRNGARPAPTFGINALTRHADRLLVGRDDGAVVDVLAGAVLTRHDSIVNTVAVSPDGATVCSADYTGVIHLVGASGTAAVVVVGRGGPINAAVWAPDGSRFFTAGYDGHVRAWSATGELIADWEAHHGPIKSLSFAATDGGIIVAGSSDGTLSAWTPHGAERWRAAAEDLVLVNAVAVAGAEATVVSASRDLHVRRWDVRTGALLERLPRVHHKSIKAIAVSDDGSRIVSGSYDGTAVAWSRRPVGWSWRILRSHGKPGVPAVALSETNAFSGGWDGTVARWALDGTLVAAYRPAER